MIDQHQYWRLWTGFLIHSDLQHFLSNAPSFAFFTGLIFGYYGIATCLALVFLSGPLIHLLSLLTYAPDVQLTGASGVVYCLAAFWLTLYACIERRHSIAGRLMRGIGFSLALLFPTTFAVEVSYRAHAIGFAVGILIAIVYFASRKEYFRRFEDIEPDV